MVEIGRTKTRLHSDLSERDTDAKSHPAIYDTAAEADARIDGKIVTHAGNASAHHVKTPKDGWHGNVARIKILPRDFLSSQAANPAYMSTGGGTVTAAGSTTCLVATVPIPEGFKATHVRIYAASEKAVNCFLGDIASDTEYDIGTGTSAAEIDITDCNWSTTNYVSVVVVDVNGVAVYGGYVTIAPI